MVLPLVFSYSVTTLRKAASSSGMNPWVHQTVAVLAAAFAMKGRANVPAAATASEPRNTERLVVLIIPVFLSSLLAPRAWPPARRSGTLSGEYRTVMRWAQIVFDAYHRRPCGGRR